MTIKSYVISLYNPSNNNNTYKLFEYLKTYNFEPILIEAIDGNKLNFDNIKQYINKINYYLMPKKAIGIALSHIKTWESFLKTNDNYAFIFEDDIVINYNKDIFYNLLNKALNNVPSDFDILYLGYYCPNKLCHYGLCDIIYKTHESKNINNYIKIPSIILTLHAYIISRKGAIKLINNIKFNLNNSIDILINNLSATNKINAYVVNPILINQTSLNKPIKTHPIILSKILSKYQINDFINLNTFLTNTNLFRIYNLNFNFIMLLFLLIGILSRIIKINIKYLTFIYILISLPDLSNNKNFNIIVINYILLILPYIIFK